MSFDRPLLALDIGTEYVKALIFLVENNEIKIINAAKIRQDRNAMKSGAVVDIQQVTETCKIAINSMIKNLQKKDTPEYCVLGIAGEFVKGVSILANYEREKPSERIDRKELENVRKSIKSDSFDQAAKEISDQIGIDKSQVVVIDVVITDTFIDNFRVSNPMGFQGKDVQFNSFASFAPALHYNALHQIAQILGLQVLSVVVEPYAVSQAHNSAKDDNFGGIFIDVGGGTTDIAVVRKGGIVDTQMIAFGSRVFTKRISNDLNMGYKEAEETKIKYSKNKLTGSLKEDVRHMLINDINVWVNGVELALNEIEDVEVFPSRMFLCGGGSTLPEIKQTLLEYPWTQVLPFNRVPRVEFLTIDQFRNVNDMTGTLNDPADSTPVAIARSVLDLVENT